MRQIRFGWMVLLLIVGGFIVEMRAQEEAALWTCVSIDKKFDKGWNMTLRGEYRAKENLSATDLYFVRLTGGYRICPYLSTALTYDYLTVQQNRKSFSDGGSRDSWKKHQHRMLADLAGRYSKAGWTISLRERYVLAYAMPTVVTDCDADGMYHRTRLQGGLGHVLRSYPSLSYHIGESRWTPFVAAEFYNNIEAGKRFELQQYHLFAGTTCKLDAHNSIQLAYIFQSKFSGGEPLGRHLHTMALYYFISL